jgi:nucleoside-diphosphate-sugar epimerase
MKILILGINGFIGSNLTQRILKDTNWEIFGLDIGNDKLGKSLESPKVHFFQGDMLNNDAWIIEHIKKCDAVLPLVAIATPATYVQDPLRVFELDFEANLKIVRHCVTEKKRIIFPSTSEVYGMCDEPEFNEETSKLILGPISKERWIYSCSKQLMDRVIYAYGKHNNLPFTLFRPFNWIGPNQDRVFDANTTSSRVVSQFLSNIIHGKNIQLVDGGQQRRCFTYIDDGIDALMKIIENKDGCANGRIFNIGNPHNDFSIAELAELIINLAKTYPRFSEMAKQCKIVSVASGSYYGQGYQDVQTRIPAINNAKEYLQWQPKVDMQTALKQTLDFYSAQTVAATV